MLSREALLPKTKYDWAKYNEGQARGKAESVVSVLTLRQIPLSEEQRRRILSEGDTQVLDRWLGRALTAVAADDVFAAP